MTSRIADQVGEPELQSQDIVLSVEGVSKRFCRSLKRSLVYGVQDIAFELIGRHRHNETLRRDEFWALKDVGFTLRRGEALGLVGANGAGKTTLLRIISGLIKPDSGLVRVKGRVAPLIALGAGFNPILTGRENIYVNMSILGLSNQEIEERFQAVLDFAEIGEAIDAPVQTYSSGMAARLGFASAIHTEPDILLIDEVLAVGDIKFRVKCYRKLAELRKQGTSFVLVSHNPHSILSICESAVYLQKGQLMAAGATDLVMKKYEESLFGEKVEDTKSTLFLQEKPREQNSSLDITSLYFKDEVGNMLEAPITGQPTLFCVEFKSYRRIEKLGLTVLIRERFKESEVILALSTINDQQSFDVVPGKHQINLQMPYLGLRPGLYTMKISISQEFNPIDILDAVEFFNFTVKSSNGDSMHQCHFYQPRAWMMLGE